ncbi:nuclear valosin-containing protein-like isoform X2 [Anopheles coustani]|uniref:nuclear valosin-containing protein-like isoform X2 n=1 Tax=Anopheles coustani TaxID=139045 RepID=UPI002657DAE2|nr:nuclear valosin-containing protein-like isoform X2 [Anopheles coustani]
MMQKKPQHFAHDPMIIPRVKQYLEENVHQTYVDVGVMARELQQRYREYYRRKAGVFRTLVEQAYRTVLHSYGLDSNPSSDNDDEALSDVEVMDETMANSRAQMNDTLTNLYMNNRNRPPASQVMGAVADQSTAGGGGGGGGGQVAIDISSDEEDGGQQAPDGSRSGAFVTSNKHVTVTKVTRTNNTRDDESSNGSASGPEGSGDKDPPVPKRRRVEETGLTMAQHLRNTLKVNKDNNSTADSAASRPNKPNKSGTNQNGTGAGQQRMAKKYRKEIVPRVVTTTFEDIGGMDRILKDLCELLLHVKHPEIYRHIGLPPPRGFLLHGPPGSGKTLLAQAIAGQLKIEMIEIPATELIGGISGESEERIREVFEQAAANAPCVLFIDEIDAISSNRINAQKDMERRIVAQLLSSLDNLGKIEGGEGVIVIGATNRADSLDPALRRVGRFDQEISLGIPDRTARLQILKIICRKLKIADSIDYGELAKLTPGYVGADLLALATRAANTAIKRLFTQKKQKLLEANELQDDTSDDVVAIDDEVDEVVNLDDDKDEEIATENETEQLNGEKDSPVKAAEMDTEPPATVNQPEESNKKVTDQDVSTAPVSEPVSSTDEQKETTNTNTEEVKEKAVPTSTEEVAPSAGGEAEKMDVDGQPTSKDEPVKSVKEPVEADTKKDAEVDKPENKSTNGPMAEEEKQTKESEKETTETQVTNTVSEEKGEEAAMEVDNPQLTSVVPPKEPVVSTKEPVVPTKDLIVKEETTLEQMMEMLLNQQNALPTDELEGLCIEREDFMESLRTVQPSAKREGFITVPDVTWNDIGSLGDIREELKLAILAPVKFPQRLKMLGLNAPSGVLLCGPPGCGKTLLAKAVANEAGINFISVKGPELLNMYVGESERAVRQCFQRARNSAPCVIFFDEFDSLCPKRSDTAEGSAGTRVVNQLLTEMDGIEERKGVFLMAATNRPDIVDPAVLRPGRLDKILYVGLPALTDRVDILRALTKNRTQPPLAADVEFEKVAELTEGYTGADLAGLVRQASLQTLKDSIVACGQEETTTDDGGEQAEMSLTVTLAHFLEAIRNIKPSVGTEDKKHYEKLRLKYGTSATC